MDVGGWLRSLGLEQYEAAFRDNAIDEKVLPRLTAEDLKELGVNALGHRRMLLDAIAALRGDTQAPLPEAPHDSRQVCEGHRRAPPGHGDVLGPGRFDGTLRPHGPGGFARGHFGLSEMRRRDRAPLRRLRGEIHGRRRARVFRLSASP